LELKIVRTKDGVLLSGALPSEIANSASLELFPLRDGAYLLSVKGFLDSAAKKNDAARQEARGTGGMAALSEKEKDLVRKLLAIRFEKRIPAEVGKGLSREENALLENLIKRGVVQVFHGGKYSDRGVYNISDAAFNAVREPVLSAPSPSAPPSTAVAAPVSSPEHLDKQGWMVLETEMDARNFANSYPEKVKTGEVRGVRAFDRKYYFVKKEFMEKWETEVLLCLGKSDKTPEEIAGEIGIPPGGCRALLLHLCENGEAMEKRRGKFSKA
jgi:hypothetical protein